MNNHLILLFILICNSCYAKFIQYNPVRTLSKNEIQALTGGLVNVKYDVNLFKVTYSSLNTKGKLDTVSGLLAIPKVFSGIFPLILFQRGTIDNRLDVPSNLQDAWQSVAISGGLGYVSISPDLLGVGDSKGFHPYLHAASESSVAFDMLQITKAHFSNQKNIILNNQLFIAGYSQGGHGSMALHQLIETKHPEIEITAATHMAGPYSLSQVMRKLILSEKAYPFPGFIAYLTLSYDYVYEWYDSLTQIFKPAYAEIMMAFYNEKIGFFKMDSLLLTELRKEFSRDLPKLMFQDSILSALNINPNHPINLALIENDTEHFAPKTYTQLVHCSGDDRVPFANSVHADSVMRSLGAKNIKLVDPSPVLDHRTCILPAAYFAVIYFETFKLSSSNISLANLSGIRIYPNPTTNEVHLMEIINTSIKVSTIEGKIIMQFHSKIADLTINTSSWVKGIYFVQFQKAGKQVTKELIVL